MVRACFITLALAACLSTTYAHPSNLPRNNKFGCGAEPSKQFLAETEKLAKIESSREGKVEVAAAAAGDNGTLTIQTWFHVVAKSTSLSDGYVPESQLTDQLAVLNSNYGMSYSLILS